MSGLAFRVASWWWRPLEDPKLPPSWAVLLVLAQDDYGDLYLPCLRCQRGKCDHAEQWWDRPFNPRRPGHWPYAVLSRLTGWVMWIESS